MLLVLQDSLNNDYSAQLHTASFPLVRLRVELLNSKEVSCGCGRLWAIGMFSAVFFMRRILMISRN